MSTKSYKRACGQSKRSYYNGLTLSVSVSVSVSLSLSVSVCLCVCVSLSPSLSLPLSLSIKGCHTAFSLSTYINLHTQTHIQTYINIPMYVKSQSSLHWLMTDNFLDKYNHITQKNNYLQTS